MSPEPVNYDIAYCFADYAVEAEILSTVGTVTRFTIDPKPNQFVDDTYQMDLTEDVPDGNYDLVFLQPKCSRWSPLTTISGDPDDHPDHISKAREIGRSIGDSYVIENVPTAPLKDPTELQGQQFGLPIQYRRAFESSFPIKRPPGYQTSFEKIVNTYYYSDRSKAWWRAVKGYTGDYPKEHTAKNCLPAIYVQTILRSWLEHSNPRDGETPQDSTIEKTTVPGN